MFLNDPKINKTRKITRLSGPYSFFYITPKIPLPEFPIMMLLGDIHGYNRGKGEKLNLCDDTYGCSEKNDCTNNQTESKECCFRLSNKNFFKLLHRQTTYENPIDIYTEHWSHEFDPQDELIMFDSELDRIDTALKRFIYRNKLEKKFKTRSRSEMLKRVKQLSRSVSRRKKLLCSACQRPITETQPYYANQNDLTEKFHIKCVNNIRWQSADARRSFAKKSVENMISNIVWDFDDDQITKFTSFQHYLLSLPLFLNGKPLFGTYEKGGRYSFQPYQKGGRYEFRLDYMIDQIVDILFDSDQLSVIRKEFRKQVHTPFKNKKLWRRVYKRSVEHFLGLLGYSINYFNNGSFIQKYIDTVYNRLHHNRMDNVYAVYMITNLLTTLVSPFLDIYTLLRIFKGGDRNPLLTIFYAGGFHSKNIYELLTQVDKTYPEYSINYYDFDLNNVYINKKQNDRCVHLNRSSIDLTEDITNLREKRENIVNIKL